MSRTFGATHVKPVRTLMYIRPLARKDVIDHAMRLRNVEWVGKPPKSYSSDVLGTLPKCVLETALRLWTSNQDKYSDLYKIGMRKSITNFLSS